MKREPKVAATRKSVDLVAIREAARDRAQARVLQLLKARQPTIPLPGFLAENPFNKIGHPKKAPRAGEFDASSDYWRRILDRVGKNLIGRDALTAQQWSEFAGPAGYERKLRDYALVPGFWFDPSRNPNAAADREIFCSWFIRMPVAFPLYLGLIREEVGKIPLHERWLCCCPFRHLLSAGELAQSFERDSGRKCTAVEIQRAMENISRRRARK